MPSNFNSFTSYEKWKNACSQQTGCLSCPLLAASPHGNCEELSVEQIEEALKNDNTEKAQSPNWNKSK